MGGITSGIGLLSGIDSASLIQQLLALESRPKFRMQERLGNLQAQKTALLDINARLLNLQNASRRFRTDSLFSAVKADSSDASILTATASGSTQPGNYNFLVRELASTSQMMSRGFATRNASPMGLSEMSFEFGNGGLSSDQSLDDLNGGQGVRRGRISITDRSGASANIDLTDVASLREVVDRINGTSGVSVSASIGEQGLVLEDTSGGSGTLAVQNVAGFSTATDLGLLQAASGNTLTGASIWNLGGATALTSLNEGNGVLVLNNVADLRITARNGSVFDIDFGRIDRDIETTTLLSDLNNGAGVRFDSDPDTADIRFIDRDGTEHLVNLSGLTTVGGLIQRVSSETGGAITLSIGDGERLVVTDTTGGSGPLKVLGTETNGTKAAEDLGILNVEGADAATFDGAVIPAVIDSPKATTLQEMLDRIEEQSNGAILARISADGRRLELEDTTGGGGNLIVRRTAANQSLAAQLGIETEPDGVAVSVLADTGRILSGLGSPLLSRLSGGGGLGDLSDLSFTDRSGNSFTPVGLGAIETIGELMREVNQQALAAGVGVRMTANNAGNGVTVEDTTGSAAGNLIISGEGATALGIAADVAADNVSGSNLQLQYVSTASRLSDLNYGRGVAAGRFRLTDGLGRTAEVNISGNESSLNEVLQKINAAGGGILAIRARINDDGDGIILEQDDDRMDGQSAFVPLKVESTSGTAAKDLNLIGSGSSVGASIDGSYERKINFEPSDTLDDVVRKIRDANIPVNVAVVNVGSGGNPFRISMTSTVSGARGEMIVDSGGVDLGLNRISEGRDAKVFFGSDDPESAFLLTSSDNVLRNVVDGLTITLSAVSDEPVTVSVARDRETVVEGLKGMLTADPSRARIQLLLPRSVLISPLWLMNRSGWARSQDGNVFVLKRL